MQKMLSPLGNCEVEVGYKLCGVGVDFYDVAQKVAVVPCGWRVGVVVDFDGKFDEVVCEFVAKICKQIWEFLEHDVDLGLIGDEHFEFCTVVVVASGV